MMTYRIRIGEREYRVEIDDLNARPVVATIDGDRYEVWPEKDTPAAALNAPAPAPRATVSPASAAALAASMLQTVQAPIPGVILSVAVKPGDSVKVGQELCILEAMKMNNIIRATRTGVIAAVHVSPGDHVRHQQALMDFAA